MDFTSTCCWNPTLRSQVPLDKKLKSLQATVSYSRAHKRYSKKDAKQSPHSAVRPGTAGPSHVGPPGPKPGSGCTETDCQRKAHTGAQRLRVKKQNGNYLVTNFNIDCSLTLFRIYNCIARLTTPISCYLCDVAARKYTIAQAAPLASWGLGADHRAGILASPPPGCVTVDPSPALSEPQPPPH